MCKMINSILTFIWKPKTDPGRTAELDDIPDGVVFSKILCTLLFYLKKGGKNSFYIYSFLKNIFKDNRFRLCGQLYVFDFPKISQSDS